MILLRAENRGIGRFEGTPKVEFLAGGNRVLLLEDFVYHDPDGRRWVAPKGLVSDGASIPRAAWTVIGPPIGGPYFFAGLLHDARYRFADCTKEQADMLLWDAALCGGTSEEHAAVIAEAVATCGNDAWEENARKRLACAADRARLLAWA
jgi:hypothetical protein